MIRGYSCAAACLMALLAVPSPALAQVSSKFRAIHAATDNEYQAFIDSLSGTALRPVFVSAVGTPTGPRFAGIAVDDGHSFPSIARHDLAPAAFQKEFDALAGKGYRLISIAGYSRGKDEILAGIWVKDGFKQQHQERYGLTPDRYQQTVTQLSQEGFRPQQVAGYQIGKTHRFAAIFVTAGDKEWVARHDLTADDYQKVFDEFGPKDFHPISVSAYATGAGTRFAIVMLRDKGAVVEARHDLTAAQYQTQFDRLTGVGMQPVQVCEYPSGDSMRFACVFARPAPTVVAGPLPMSGIAVPELKAFDDAMQKFMRDRNIPAGTLAVMHKGKIVLERGFGWQDPEHAHLCGPQTPMRIASISKPLTLAALLKLIRAGKVTPQTKPFVYLDIQSPPGRTMDKRLLNITVQDLMDHKGGWDRDKAGDPMFMSLKIAKALGKTGPASSADVIAYMAGQPLQFDPGSKRVYSNFGYCVLARVIEKASGKKYIDVLQAEITRPLGLASIQLARTLPKDRNPKEPYYSDPGYGANVMNPASKSPVPAPDGTFHIEAMDAHGGLIASAPDLVRFSQAYWVDGPPRLPGQKGSGTFFGSLPGTNTMLRWRPDGVNIAVLFNQREDPSGLPYDDIEALMDRTAAGIKTWPQ